MQQIDALPHKEGKRTITSTMVNTMDLCPRRFWFRYVLRVPEERKKVFTIGSVLHAMNERRQLCGPQGIVPTKEQAMQWTDQDPFENGGPLWGQQPGQPVDIFPSHYAKVKERDGSWAEITDAGDRLKVMDLYKTGDKCSSLDHWPEEGRIIERMVFLELPRNQVYRSFIDHGYIGDARTEPIIQDYKTAANRSYTKSVEELASNLQLSSYAKGVLKMRDEAGLPPAKRIKQGHLNYCKNDGKVFARDVWRTPDQVEVVWQKIVGMTEKMADLFDAGIHEDWQAVEGPAPGSDACSKFGREGCPFQKVCTLQANIRTVKPDIDDLMAKNPAPPIVVPPATTTAPTPSPVPSASELPYLPWRKHDCPDCGGSGVTAQLQPCGTCQGHAPGEHQPLTCKIDTDLETGEFVARFTTPMTQHMAQVFAAGTAEGQVPMNIIGNRVDSQGWSYIWLNADGSWPAEEPALDVTAYGLENPIIPEPEPMNANSAAPVPSAPVAPVAPAPAATIAPVAAPVAAPTPATTAPAPVAAAPVAAAPVAAPAPQAADPAPTAAVSAAVPDSPEESIGQVTVDNIPDQINVNRGKAPGAKGKAPKTFTLAVGTNLHLEGVGEVLNGEEYLAAAQAQVCNASPNPDGTIPHFLHLETWKRREAVALHAQGIADAVKGKILHFMSADGEAKLLVQALAAKAHGRIFGA